MIEIDPTVRPAPLPEDLDRALRPQMLDEFVGGDPDEPRSPRCALH